MSLELDGYTLEMRTHTEWSPWQHQASYKSYKNCVQVQLNTRTQTHTYIHTYAHTHTHTHTHTHKHTHTHTYTHTHTHTHTQRERERERETPVQGILYASEICPLSYSGVADQIEQTCHVNIWWCLRMTN